MRGVVQEEVGTALVTPGGMLHGFRHPVMVVRRVVGGTTEEVEEAVPAEAAEVAVDREAEGSREVAVFREPAEAAEAAVEGSREVAVFREPAEVEEEAVGPAGHLEAQEDAWAAPVEDGSHAHSASATPRRGGTTSASSSRRLPPPIRRGGSARWTS